MRVELELGDVEVNIDVDDIWSEMQSNVEQMITDIVEGNEPDVNGDQIAQDLLDAYLSNKENPCSLGLKFMEAVWAALVYGKVCGKSDSYEEQFDMMVKNSLARIMAPAQAA